MALVEKGVAAHEGRFLVRVLRSLNAQRRKFNKTVLGRAVATFLTDGQCARSSSPSSSGQALTGALFLPV